MNRYTYMKFVTREGKVADVEGGTDEPNVRGLTYLEALNELGERGWKLRMTRPNKLKLAATFLLERVETANESTAAEESS